MIILLIMTLLLIGMISIVAHGLSGLYSSAYDINQQNQEMRLERIWENAITERLVRAGPNGHFMAPLGKPIFNEVGNLIGHGLPEAAVAPDQNSYGLTVLYCALAQQGIDPDLAVERVQLTETVGYDVQTISINGQDYVYGAGDIERMQRHSPNVIGFVMSPLTHSPGLSCADIIYDSLQGKYSVQGRDVNVIPIMTPYPFGAMGFSTDYKNENPADDLDDMPRPFVQDRPEPEADEPGDSGSISCGPCNKGNGKGHGWGNCKDRKNNGNGNGNPHNDCP